jgi:hypothetical protein
MIIDKFDKNKSEIITDGWYGTMSAFNQIHSMKLYSYMLINHFNHSFKYNYPDYLKVNSLILPGLI